MTSSIMNLQNLAMTVNGFKQNLELERTRVSTLKNSNNPDLSNYHAKFAELLNKYFKFGVEYEVELNTLNLALLKEIELEQQKEAERIEKLVQEKLETISNRSIGSNLEIEDNVAETEYSSGNSDHISSDIDVPQPQQIKAKKSIPVKQPNDEHKVQIPSKVKPKQQKQKNKNKNNKNSKNKNKNKNKKKEEAHYVYNAERVKQHWKFRGPVKSTTMVYIGNIPHYVKIAGLQFFVMKKAKVSMRMIEETILKNGRYNKYALVRFRSDVSMDKVVQFMDNVNNENVRIAEERKKVNHMIPSKKTGKKGNDDQKQKENKKIKTSWQTKVFIKWNDNRKYYESEDDMFTDPDIRNTLFIRNFDILNNKCHEELTNVILEFGELSKDIEIGVDSWCDPYCIASFKDINNAIMLRNCSVDFKGRWLEINYSRF